MIKHKRCSVCGDMRSWQAVRVLGALYKVVPCLRQDNLYVSITKAVSSDMLFIEVPSVDRKYMKLSNTSPQLVHQGICQEQV